MKEPTLKDFDDLLTRLTNAGWIEQGYVVEDPSGTNPFGIIPTAIGDYRLKALYHFLLELGRPAPSDAEWYALFGLVLRYGQRNSNPE